MSDPWKTFNEMLDELFPHSPFSGLTRSVPTRAVPTRFSTTGHTHQVKRAKPLMDLVCLNPDNDKPVTWENRAPSVNDGPLFDYEAVQLWYAIENDRYPQHRCSGPHVLWEPTTSSTYRVLELTKEGARVQEILFDEDGNECGEPTS